MPLHLVTPRLGVARPDAAYVGVEHVEQHALLGGGQITRDDALVLKVGIVAEGRGEDLGGQLGRQHRAPALLGRERAHQRQPWPLLGLEHSRTGELALGGRDGLGAHEHRRHHDLIAENEAVDDQMMAVDLPAPRAVV
jgi:hypothetical protein